jgi:hypothetical protein
MHQGQLVFSQLMRHLPLTTFRRCVARYAGEHKVKSFSCLDQYLCMAFAQLTYRESLRDIEASLRAQAAKLYHLGIRGSVSRNTLANANATRDWRIYASFAERLIGIARGLYAEEPFGVDLAQTVFPARKSGVRLIPAPSSHDAYRLRRGHRTGRTHRRTAVVPDDVDDDQVIATAVESINRSHR